MHQYEYTSVRLQNPLDMEDRSKGTLKHYGEEGWELCTCDFDHYRKEYIYYFKREYRE